MQRLFMVAFKADHIEKDAVAEVYFRHKPDAKKLRDRLIAQGVKAHVAPGPDHRNYKNHK